MRKKIIAGNWKMNKTPSEAAALAKEISEVTKGAACDVVVCPTAVCLSGVVSAIGDANVGVGAQNVHFEETLENNDIVFPYRLLKGKATTRNAIALLSIMGYDSAITNMARNQAQRFEINHKWEVLP